MKDRANSIEIDVIQEISKNKNSKILDKEAIELLYQKFQNGEIIAEDENEDSSSIMISEFENGKGGSIAVF